MNLKMEVLFFIANGRYKMVKNPKDKEVAFRDAVESVRKEFYPYEDPSDFLGNISSTRKKMTKEIYSTFFAQLRAGLSYQEISDLLIPHVIKKETKDEVYVSPEELALIASRDLELIGGPDYASTDVMSAYELHFLHLEDKEEKTTQIVQPQPTVLTTTPSITERVKKKVRKIKRKIEKIQLSFSFPDSNEQLEFGY